MAEAGNDSEVEADVEHGAADGAAACQTFQVLQGWHEECGIVRAGGAGWAWRALADGEGLGGEVLGFGGCWGGLGLRGAGAGLDEGDVFAGGGAGEEDAFQGDGTQDASVQVGEDRGNVGGAEAHRDGAEPGGGGALADGVDEMAAVGQEDANGVEENLDVVGQSGGGVILCGIWRGGGWWGGFG